MPGLIARARPREALAETPWTAAGAVFDRRLDRGATAPIAVAFSGGGDSLAALIATLAWARSAGRPVTAIGVDHRLQPQSREWLQFAEAASKRLGAGFRAVAWDAKKPVSGLPAAARAARHRLIADAARTAGASVVVFGHTADDVFEGDLMRAEGSSLGRLREWSPSPAWPEGRGLFIVRPLLAVRRAAIREALRARGEPWIDDPANDDTRFARARARVRAPAAGEAAAVLDRDQDLAELAALAEITAEGLIGLDRRTLAEASSSTARRLLSAALVCAGGGDRPPRARRLSDLLARLARPAEVTATLAGTRVEARGHKVLIARDPGQARRGGLAPSALAAGVTLVWDGRFEVASGRADGRIDLLSGHAARLDKAERRVLADLPALVRAALPVVIDPSGAVSCPILAPKPGVEVRPLIQGRFLAACGTISQEGAA